MYQSRGWSTHNTHTVFVSLSGVVFTDVRMVATVCTNGGVTVSSVFVSVVCPVFTYNLYTMEYEPVG